MMKSSQPRKKVRGTFAALCFVDKCLLLVLCLLLAQSAFALFFPVTGSEAEHIDVIVRTATAAIFGYVISANFSRCGSEGRASKTASQTIGFSAADQSTVSPRSGAAAPDNGAREGTNAVPPPALSRPDNRPNLQTLVTTCICLFSVLVLIAVRNAYAFGLSVNSGATASVAQFRDFVSASVGFLIGTPSESGSSR